jgi:hypothetical protein
VIEDMGGIHPANVYLRVGGTEGPGASPGARHLTPKEDCHATFHTTTHRRRASGILQHRTGDNLECSTPHPSHTDPTVLTKPQRPLFHMPNKSGTLRMGTV